MQSLSIRFAHGPQMALHNPLVVRSNIKDVESARRLHPEAAWIGIEPVLLTRNLGFYSRIKTLARRRSGYCELFPWHDRGTFRGQSANPAVKTSPRICILGRLRRRDNGICWALPVLAPAFTHPVPASSDGLGRLALFSTLCGCRRGRPYTRHYGWLLGCSN